MGESARIYASLVRPPFFLGVPLEALLVELGLLAALFLTLGLSRAFFAVAALTVGIAHHVLQRVSARDPLAIRIVFDALAYETFYPARAQLSSRSEPAPRPCLGR